MKKLLLVLAAAASIAATPAAAQRPKFSVEVYTQPDYHRYGHVNDYRYGRKYYGYHNNYNYHGPIWRSGHYLRCLVSPYREGLLRDRYNRLILVYDYHFARRPFRCY